MLWLPGPRPLVRPVKFCAPLGVLVTMPEKQVPDSGIPDLKNIPLDQLVTLDDSVLARSLDLYRQRLADKGVLLNNFNARI